jgi:hypothetical protein
MESEKEAKISMPRPLDSPFRMDRLTSVGHILLMGAEIVKTTYSGGLRMNLGDYVD